MELEEMQAVWSEMSDQLEKQKKLTNEIILKMTQQQYKKKINKIVYSELIGFIICLISAIYILINFHKLDHWFTISCGIITLALFIVGPIISFNWLKRMKKINVIDNNYKQTLTDFAKIQEKAFKYKNYSYVLGIGAMLITVPVFAKIMGGKDLEFDPGLLFDLFVGVIITSVFIYFITKFYGRTMKSAADTLAELGIEDE
ncbi:hypothetical protein GTQ40_15450 [Flavobacteriaceae bacterium R38]|nr:hypothetical protein [Flavobacteriaceae bacterium R38]